MHYNQIINLVRDNGPISRIEISEKVKVPKPTVTRIINKLIKMNILKENGLAPSSGGRRPVLLEFNKNCYYSIGFEIGRTSMKLALTNMDGEILAFKESSYQLNDLIDDILQFAKGAVNEVIEEAKVDADLLLGMGIGLPGPVYIRDNKILKSPNFMQGKENDLPELLHQHFNFPIQFDKDSSVAALAEKWFGKGIGKSNFVYVMADEGIGCGIFLKHELYRGIHGEAGGLGHTIVDIFGKECTCGNYGCLETFVSQKIIIENVKSRLKLASTEERELFDSMDQISMSSISEAVEKGSSIAMQTLKEAGLYLGVGLSNVISYYDPEVIILGGAIGASHPILKEATSESINQRVIGTYGKQIEVTISEIKESAVLGAAALIIDDHFKIFSNSLYV